MSQRQRSFVEETRLNAKMIIARVFSTKRGARSLMEKVSSLVSCRRNAPCALFTLVCFMFHFFLNFLFFFFFCSSSFNKPRVALCARTRFADGRSESLEGRAKARIKQWVTALLLLILFWRAVACSLHQPDCARSLNSSIQWWTKLLAHNILFSINLCVNLGKHDSLLNVLVKYAA